MGKRERRSFSAEFKREAVALATQATGSVSEVARQLGIASSLLTRWVRQAKAHGTKAFPGQGVARDEELMRLRRELAQVKKERDFEHSAIQAGRLKFCHDASCRHSW